MGATIGRIALPVNCHLCKNKTDLLLNDEVTCPDCIRQLGHGKLLNSFLEIIKKLSKRAKDETDGHRRILGTQIMDDQMHSDTWYTDDRWWYKDVGTKGTVRLVAKKVGAETEPAEHLLDKVTLCLYLSGRMLNIDTLEAVEEEQDGKLYRLKSESGVMGGDIGKARPLDKAAEYALDAWITWVRVQTAVSGCRPS